MEYSNLSDLEEGEILEFESVSPSDSRCNDFGIKGCSFRSFRKEYKNFDFELKGNQDRDVYVCEQGRNGNINRSLKHKLKLGKKVRGMKSSVTLVDLESISSEEEHKSNEENKYSSENKKCTIHSEDRSEKKKQTTQFYGAVEDIMSEIGETICRKSRCNYKKRKSKEPQYKLKKYSDKSYDLWSHKIFASHIKSKKHKRNVSFSDSDSDSSSDRAEKRKKKKRRREFHYETNKKSKKNLKVRDFDEMRRTLLERLKKQQAEEKLKETECAPEIENSEIQEVDMLIDCTNYVDSPKAAVPKDSTVEGVLEEQEREDELDLIKLRLIALASNKRQNSGETSAKTVKTEEISGKKNSLNRSKEEEMDLDRNELLLRAEALKTALLKKHQKRLTRLKMKKAVGTESAKDKNGVNSSVENLSSVHPEEVAAYLDEDACKENVERENENVKAGGYPQIPDHEVKTNELSETPSVSSGCLKKPHSKPRIRRKKRKSVSFANSVKENNDINEVFEEDDRTLRSQLLSDLMKKKSLKSLQEKSVLTNSTQTTTNKLIPSDISDKPPKENGLPLPVIKNTFLKNVNSFKAVKPVTTVAKVPKPEIQRIIVHLGSEESSDEDNITFCQTSTELVAEGDQEKEKSNGDAVLKWTNMNSAIQADHERSVELLLSQARKKIEGEKRIIYESNIATPEAVYKHLPPSQRLEYIRLKQKIAERERLRKERMKNSNNYVAIDSRAFNSTIKETPVGKETGGNLSQEFKAKPENNIKAPTKPAASSSSSSSVYKSNVPSSKPPTSRTADGLANLNGLKTKEVSQRRPLNKTKNNSEGVCGKERKPEISIHRNRLLLPSSQALMLKLKLLLKKIKIEKMIEENYDKEIVKLKNQLSVLEKKKNEQRFKIKKFGEESMKTYKAILGITAKSNEKTVTKEDEGAREKREGGDSESKDEGKKPEGAEGKIVLNETELELTQSKTDKRLSSEDKTSETATTRETSAGVCPLEYHSPLQVFNKVSDCSERVDPNVMMCQFDLTGVCKDEECAYQHVRAS